MARCSEGSPSSEGRAAKLRQQACQSHSIRHFPGEGVGDTQGQWLSRGEAQSVDRWLGREEREGKYDDAIEFASALVASVLLKGGSLKCRLLPQ